MIGTGDGWLVVAAKSSMGGTGSLNVVRVDVHGHHVAHGELARSERIGAPVIARAGARAAVVFTRDHDVAFLPLGLDGVATGPAVIVDRFGTAHADEIGSGLVPDALHWQDDAWWIGEERRVGVGHYQVRVLRTDGVHVSKPFDLAGTTGVGSFAISLAPTGAGLTAAVYDDRVKVLAFALCASRSSSMR